MSELAPLTARLRRATRTAAVSVLMAAAAGAAAIATPAALGAPAPSPAASQTPPALPGPPPGADTGYPAAPAVGAPALGGAVGPAVRVPGHVATPGLLGSTALLKGRTVTLPIACPGDGRAQLTDPAVAAGTLARSRYDCASGRATVSFTLTTARAARARALTTSLATISLGAGHATASFSVDVAAKVAAAPNWGTDGGLACSFYGSHRALLVAPNFTVTPNATIDIRPWVAFYTAASGWQWLGTAGPGQSAWSQWTASPTGVLEWSSPAGALDRWTWSPITVPAGRPLWMVAGFEVVYLYAHPRYAWAFTGAQTATGASAPLCSYR